MRICNMNRLLLKLKYIVNNIFKREKLNTFKKGEEA